MRPSSPGRPSAGSGEAAETVGEDVRPAAIRHLYDRALSRAGGHGDVPMARYLTVLLDPS